MVARVWKAALPPARVPDYQRHFAERVAPVLASTPGYRGSEILVRRDVEPAELVVLTWWSSLDAIRGFAGADVRRAVVDPEARTMLARSEDTVTHYDVVIEHRVGDSPRAR
jgi:heme-degrading monooxygenase HmoA